MFHLEQVLPQTCFYPFSELGKVMKFQDDKKSKVLQGSDCCTKDVIFMRSMHYYLRDPTATCLLHYNKML
jgi:hypothetical protein